MITYFPRMTWNCKSCKELNHVDIKDGDHALAEESIERCRACDTRHIVDWTYIIECNAVGA